MIHDNQHKRHSVTYEDGTFELTVETNDDDKLVHFTVCDNAVGVGASMSMSTNRFINFRELLNKIPLSAL
jgi:hypothetical protein